jgi:hypothetical protein
MGGEYADIWRTRITQTIESKNRALTGFGRPTIEELGQDLSVVLKKCRPDWDITKPELKAAWERGEHDRFYPYGKTYGQVFRQQG